MHGVCRKVYLIIIDFTGDAHAANPRPISASSLELLQEVLDGGTHSASLLRSNLCKWLDLGGGARLHVKSSEGQSDIGTANITNEGDHCSRLANDRVSRELGYHGFLTL